MNTEKVLKHQELTARIIRVFFEVYNEQEAGLTVEREMPLEVRFRGRVVGQFRADLVVGGAVLVETKACPSLHPAHNAQVLNYLRATVLEIGLLLNFGPRPGIKRLAFDNSRKVRLTNASMEVEHRRSASPRIDPSPSMLICG